MVNWDDEDVKKFKEEARTLQQKHCDQLGDREWDMIEIDELTILRKKVGYGLYGLPPLEPNINNRNIGYPKEKLDVIEKICDQLVGINQSKSGLNFKYHNIHFACIFLELKVFDNRDRVPLFKAKGENDDSSKCVFVDKGARKYSSWAKYLSDNTLEKCICCFPIRGMYNTNRNGEVCVGFYTSPACKLAHRVLNMCDKVATVAAVAATGVGLAAMFAVPIAGPIIAATTVAGVSTGAYGVTRSSYALYDRANHSQSISFLKDSEARGCWLSIAGSSLGFAEGRMIASMTKAARAGEVMGKAGRIAFKLIQAGSFTVNGIGVVHGLSVLVEKQENNELTPLDVFQFTSSVLFYTHSVVNMKTASTIIKEVQHEVIDSHKQGLNKRAEKLFNKQTSKLRRNDELYGNAKVVKQLNRIQNTKELYKVMTNKNVQSNKVKLTDKGFKGQLVVNKNLKIHPLKLLEIPPESRKAIFNSTKSLAKGTITQNQFHNEMKTICKTHRIAFEPMRKETQQKFCKIFGKDKFKDIDIGGRKVFANALPHQLDRLRVVLENTAQNDETIILKAAEFAKKRGCTTTEQYIAYTESFVAGLNETVMSYEVNYQKDLAVAQQKPEFNQTTFDENRGLKSGMKRTTFHKQKALGRFSCSEGYDELNQRYDAVKSNVTHWNDRCPVGFFGDDTATCHYLKHKNVGSSGELTPQQYFKLAEEVVGNPTNKTNSMLSQDGSCTLITYLEPQRGVRAIKIDLTEGGSGIATVMYDGRVLSRE